MDKKFKKIQDQEGILQNFMEQLFQELEGIISSVQEETLMDPGKFLNANVFLSAQNILQKSNKALYQVSTSDLADEFEESSRRLRIGLADMIRYSKNIQDNSEKMDMRLERKNNECVMDKKHDLYHSNGVLYNEEQLTPSDVRGLMKIANESARDAHLILGRIDRRDFELLAELSLNISHVVLPMGATFFSILASSFSDRAKLERSKRIQIIEISEDNVPEKKKTPKVEAFIRSLYQQFTDYASRNPYFASIITALGLPFIGFLIPLLGLVAIAIVIENHAPEYAATVYDVFQNLVQMIKLWIVILKIGIRNGSVALIHGAQYLYEESSRKGIFTTTKNVFSSVYKVSSLIITSLFTKGI